MAFLWGIGIGFGLLGSIVVLLYSVRSERRQYKIPYLGLFVDSGAPEPRRLWIQKLRHPLSLLLQLAILVLFALALLFREPSRLSSRPELWLVDIGLGMSERGPGDSSPNRTELLQRRLRQQIESLSEGTDVALVGLGNVPQVLLGASHDRDKLRQAVNELAPLDAWASYGDGISFAESLAHPTSQLVVFGDERAFARSGLEASKKVRFIPIPRASGAPNLSVSAFAARRYPLGAGQVEVSLSVHSDAAEALAVRATLFAVELPSAREIPIEAVEFEARAGRDTLVPFRRRSGIGKAISCRIERVDGAPDPVVSDNVARAMVPAMKRISVLVVGEESLFLTAALFSAAEVEVEHILARDYAAKSSTAYDLTIFREQAEPPAKDSGALLFLGSKGPGHPVELGKALASFGFDESDRRHKLFRLFDPYDTQIVRGFSLVPRPEDRVLAESQGLPIVIQGARSGRAFLSLGFAPEDSDMVLRPAFPLFIRGVLEELVESESTAWTSPAKAGASVSVSFGEGVLSYEWQGPLGEPHRARGSFGMESGRADFSASRAGFYELKAPRGDAQYVAINPNSDFATSVAETPTLPPLRGPSPMAEKELGRTPSSARLWTWVAALVAALILVEYYLFHRRWVV
jgi:Ca-activated chloride channel homolog